MGLIKLITEQESFQLSYTVPYNRVPYILDKVTQNNPELVTHEDDSGMTYVVNKETNELILKYDFDSRTMFSDYKINDLLQLGSD